MKRFLTSVFFMGLVLALAGSTGLSQAQSPGSLGSVAPRATPVGTAFCGYNSQIDIAPALPTPDDTIQITPSGDWSDMCTPSYQSHQVMDNVIRIDAILDYPPDVYCLYVITPWGFTVDAGNLPSGSYRVDVYITDMFRTTTLCGTKSFTVVDNLWKITKPEFFGR